VHAPFENLVMTDQRTEVLTEVALQYRVSEDEQRGCDPVEWRDGWYLDHDRNRMWSEPLYAVGGHCLGQGSVPYTDARKSAVTNGLGKASSMLGIGHEVFKGMIRADTGGNGRGGNGSGHGGSNGNGSHRDAVRADPTAFWALYNNQAKTAGVSIEIAKDLAGRGNWDVAIQELQDLISLGAN
ncbi:MAG: hypothetical protein MUQ10_09315, partial [Anaerolineae bacterium]|nr:hypothetical protein [Anaerolineae bacterium]